MPFVKATFFFEQNGYGWTESLWQNAPDPVDLNTFLPKVQAYATKRAPVCGRETLLTYARLSNENVYRDAIFLGLGAGLKGTAGQSSDAPDTAVLFQWRNNAGGKRRRTYVRGVWDGMIDKGGQFIPDDKYQPVINAWVGQVTQDSWGWITRGSRVQGDVKAATADPASGQVNVTLKAPLFAGPLPRITRVQISGVHGAYQINGSQLVYPTAVDAFTTKDRIAIFPYTSGGVVTWWTPTFQIIDVGGADRVVERKAGRPSFLSRGRAKAKVKS